MYPDYIEKILNQMGTTFMAVLVIIIGKQKKNIQNFEHYYKNGCKAIKNYFEIQYLRKQMIILN